MNLCMNKISNTKYNIYSVALLCYFNLFYSIKLIYLFILINNCLRLIRIWKSYDDYIIIVLEFAEGYWWSSR